MSIYFVCVYNTGLLVREIELSLSFLSIIEISLKMVLFEIEIFSVSDMVVFSEMC